MVSCKFLHNFSDMRIAANKEKQRATNEVVYYGQFGENPYDMNVTRLDSLGGWIASPASLAQFLDHVAGSGTIPAMAETEDDSDDDDTGGGVSAELSGKICARLDGTRERCRKLVAQRQPAGDNDRCGPDCAGRR
jgi:hypothetical protein